MATDWLTVRRAAWEAVEFFGQPEGAEVRKIKIGGFVGFVRRTATGGVVYEEYGRNQCNENPVRRILREALKTDLVSYLGELNDHGNYAEGHPDFEALWKREYPK